MPIGIRICAGECVGVGCRRRCIAGASGGFVFCVCLEYVLKDCSIEIVNIEGTGCGETDHQQSRPNNDGAASPTDTISYAT